MKDKKAKPLDTEEEIKKLGARLRYLRIQAGYTSAETFAYEKGISRALYGRYERGKDLRYSSLVRLANCFNMTVAEMLSIEVLEKDGKASKLVSK
jgi:transcriptional regulator with XRE-family HTH domain